MRKNESKASRKIYGKTIIERDGCQICPICSEKINSGDAANHHVFWHMMGGHGFRWNILLICARCHASLTAGNKVDRWLYNAVCTRFMLGRYGLLYALQDERLRESVKKAIIDRMSNEKSIFEASREVNEEIRAIGQEGYIELVSLMKRGPGAIVEYFDDIVSS
ncbi:MAG: hypothetical protein KJ077_08625 [Anaerolineae bacterium]|nr:hypothetical protein [Anaerolineae bacterium]